MTHTGLIIDSHTHIYPEHDVTQFLSSAIHNLKSIAPNAYRALILTEREEEDAFTHLKLQHLAGNFTIRDTDEQCSIDVKIANGKHLSIIAGKQVNTYEGLEVLALGTTNTIPSRNPLKDTVSYILGVGAIPVIPWSFGKWVGRRKKTLFTFLESVTPSACMLGDIAGRGAFLAAEDVLHYAASRGFKILHGTDPLPIPHEELIVGSFASFINCHFDPRHPAQSLKHLWTSQIEARGKRNSSIVSLKRQAHLRLR